MEAIEAGKTIDKIFVQGGLQGDIYSELKKLLKKYNIRPNTVPVEKLNRFTRKNHQGVVAFISEIPFYKIEDFCHKFLKKEKLRFY
jgi:23S rRNA (guanosine2251-2'-O)-methyltransferase